VLEVHREALRAAPLAQVVHFGPQRLGELVDQPDDVVVAGSLPSVFASFEIVPLAAASIGQAHAATLRDATGGAASCSLASSTW
jgi:hypothetical protein